MRIRTKDYQSLRTFAIRYLLDDIDVEDATRVIADWDYTQEIMASAHDTQTLNQIKAIYNAYQNYDDQRAYQLAVKYFGSLAKSCLHDLADILPTK